MSRWIIPGLLHQKLTIVAGHPTGGKSTWTYNLARAYLDGGEFMGQAVAAPTGKKVLILCTDLDGIDDAADTMSTLTDASWIGVREFSPAERDYPPEWWSRFGAAVAAGGYGLVVVDNAAGLLGDDETINSDSDARKIITRMKALVGHGLAVTLLTHTNNSGEFGGTPEWRKATRCIVTIGGKAPKASRTIRTQNNGTNLEPFVVRLAAGSDVLLELAPERPERPKDRNRSEVRADERDLMTKVLNESGRTFGNKIEAVRYLMENRPEGVQARATEDAMKKYMERCGVI